VSREAIDKLLHAAVQAPTGMNAQPWAFGVIQDKETLRNYSDRTKTFLLGKIAEWPWLERYREHFVNPGYSVFYSAPALVVIYAKAASHIAQIDCALAAENLILTACDMGLGSCWIGFATEVLNASEAKKELGVPEEYTAIAPIIVGYPDGPPPEREKNPPEVIFRR
jgi:nitroreductase